uniref:Cell cycle link (CLINK) protein n=1 Tax=Milk vetch dwarf virus TaxID=67585 RepID=A0A0N7MDX1_9VIRU|nr:cell cycle link protein [Milk vetch dwarf virus]CUR70734.1 cell cycle link (CLINK) protein [Milk vetch dwarf virus]CUR70735.1 cell cycle link (CLINK) protein [Milk vetch dwarf virus]
MGLKYFAHLPVELREKIVRDHLQEERKKEFLEKAIEDSCRRHEALLIEDPSPAELSSLSKFLNALSDYVGNQFNTRCLIKWKKDVPSKVKFGYMEEQHLKLYGSMDMDDLACGELLLPDEEDDLTYEDGVIVRCSELDQLFKSLGIAIVYIVVSKHCIWTPLSKEIVIK